MLLQVLIVFLVLAVATCEDYKKEAVEYLSKYGYTETSGTEAGGSDDLGGAIKNFQTFNGLSPTGKLDSKTIKLMKVPRCGVSDKPSKSGNFEQPSSFVRMGVPWKKKTITYRIVQYPRHQRLSKRVIDMETKKAFSMWEEVADIRFVKSTTRSADIEIKWGKYKHGAPGYAFDGQWGTLAHAWAPRYSRSQIEGKGHLGDVHMDDSETWSVTPNKGAQLLWTLAHEFGHSIGLDHTSVPGSIMVAGWSQWKINLRLSYDDKRGAQRLYGPPQKGRPRPTDKPDRSTTRKPSGTPNIKDCKYTCDSRYGGCIVRYIGPPRGGLSKGYCTSTGKCSGTPPECQNCNRAITC